MAKMLGQPVDPELVESIEKEERLNRVLFKEEKQEQKHQIAIFEIFPPPATNNQLTEQIPQIAQTNIVPKEQDLIQQTVNVLKATNKNKEPDDVEKELGIIRKTVAEMMQKISTMSWGGGGTGVVRFLDLDDHQHPEDVRYLRFNMSGPIEDPPDGSISWNASEECVDVHQTDGTTLQVGLEQYIRITNVTGNTLNSGTLVSFTGVNGNKNPTAGPLVANSTFNPFYTIGVLTESLANSITGRATTFGKVKEIDTTGDSSGESWSIGDLLWANPDPAKAGLLTNNKPTAPNIAISIAAVTNVGVNDGEILVRPTIAPRLYYGNFSHVGGNQTAANANTPYIVQWNTTEFSSGHRIGANNDIIADYAGLYNYQFSLQVSSTTSSKSDIYIWAKKNEDDIPDSASLITVATNDGNAVPAWNFVVSMHAGDRFQLMWAVSSTSLFLRGGAENAWHPTIPSALLTVTQVNQ